jgi:hypothetical protein
LITGDAAARDRVQRRVDAHVRVGATVLVEVGIEDPRGRNMLTSLFVNGRPIGTPDEDTDSGSLELCSYASHRCRVCHEGLIDTPRQDHHDLIREAVNDAQGPHQAATRTGKPS